PAIDDAAWAKAMTGDALSLLGEAAVAFQTVEWHAESLKRTVEELGAARGLKLGKAQAPIRVAVTGRTVGLPLFESLEVLGRDRTVGRIRAAIDPLS
ncbi:glutamate--tRNA ligase, partial [Micromonospora sp. MP36]